MSLHFASHPAVDHSAQDLFRLDGRVAVVTGAAGAIGSAVADRLAQAGAALMLVDAGATGAEMAAVTVAHRHGGAALAAELDLRRSTAATALVERVMAELRGLDVWINAPSPAVSLEDAYRSTEAAAESLPAGGAIVNIAQDDPALGDLTHALALVFGPRGIRVVGLAPALDATPDEIALVTLFLAGDGAAGIAGTTIPLSGRPGR